MGCLFFFELVTMFLGALITTNRLVNDLVSFDSFGRVSWNRPPPPPPIFSSTSVEEETLRSFFTTATATTTVTTTPTFFPLEIVTSPTPSPTPSPSGFNHTDSSPPPISFFHQLHTSIFDTLVQFGFWVFSVVGEILIAISQILVIITPQATVAYILREQRRQDLANLDVGGVASLGDFWDQLNLVNDQDWIVAALRDDLAKMTRKADAQRKEHDAFVQMLQMGQDEFVQTLRKEGEAKLQTLQLEHEAKVRTLRQGQDLCVQTLQTGQDALVQTLRKGQAVEVQTLQKGRKAAEDTLLEIREKVATSENTIDELKLSIAGAHQRLTEAKVEADQHILDLERTLTMERQSAKKEDDELAAARELIRSLETTIASNSSELLVYRNQAGAQHQSASGQLPTHPPPPPTPTPSLPPAPFVPRPSAATFVPRPSATPFVPRPSGMPPNRTSGFMGNLPPPPPPQPRQIPTPPGPFVPMPPNRSGGFMGNGPPRGW